MLRAADFKDLKKGLDSLSAEERERLGPIYQAAYLHWFGRENVKLGHEEDYVIKSISWDDASGGSVRVKFKPVLSDTEFTVDAVMYKGSLGGHPLWVAMERQLRELLEMAKHEITLGGAHEIA